MCVSGDWVDPALELLPAYESVEVSCDGLDNDCDGTTDEDMPTVSCGIGLCARKIPTCVEGRVVACDPLVGASLEVCDGLDNDCDGASDEELGEVSCGVGECLHSEPLCRDGRPVVCDAFLGAAPERCDGRDNDCDARTDENLGSTTCGTGVCARSIPTCENGRANVCGPSSGASAELCDGLDNDCDGVTDEQAACGVDQICQSGRCVADPAAAVCGDNRVTGDEDCDDGNRNDLDDCGNDCRVRGLCTNTCQWSRDGECDDGGLGSNFDVCTYGSDCADCTARVDEPCWEFPRTGVCIDHTTLKTCVVPTGESRVNIVTSQCLPHEVCATTTGLGAFCTLNPTFDCVPGTSGCLGGNLRECDELGQWHEEACAAGCIQSPLGSACEMTGFQVVSGRLTYEYRTMNEARSDWGAIEVKGLATATLVSYQWDPEADEHVAYDVAVSADDGSYSIRIPESPLPEDLVVVWLVGLDAQSEIAFAVASPYFDTPGKKDEEEVWQRSDESGYWGFNRASELMVEFPDLHITEETGSAMVRVFDVLQFTYVATRRLFGRDGDSLVVWMQEGVAWSCLACFWSAASRVGARTFRSNIWMPHDDDQQYWSSTVTGHELGHWVMSAFGTSPAEGGPHGRPLTLPGQAWSEGFATFFSSLVKASEIYFDKQSGTAFWRDLRAMKRGGTSFELPTADGRGYPDPDDPVLQMFDEYMVAAIGYNVALATVASRCTDTCAYPDDSACDDGGPDHDYSVCEFGSDCADCGARASPFLLEHGQPFMDALASPGMNVTRSNPTARFARGYARHEFEVGDDGVPYDIRATAQAAPMLADYLDALRCVADADGLDLDPAIQSAILAYPYPVDEEPICQ